MWKKYGMLFALFPLSNEVLRMHLYISEHKNQRKRSFCYINLMYQVSTFYSEKSLNNQKVHLRLLKRNVTNNILQLP